MSAVITLLVIIVLIATLSEYRPKKEEIIFSKRDSSGSSPLPDRFRIVSWNIGYGGLGDNMDFFYDGGRKVRDTKERTIENIKSVIAELKEQDADIYLLQEVDMDSKRTYHIDEVDMLRKEFPGYHIYFAHNYNSFFVPKPLREPIGKVESGVVILTRYLPEEVTRYQYPSKFPWPISIFNLKRCLLTAQFSTADGRKVIIGNTHNTAYDRGGMRSKEMKFLGKMVEENHKTGVVTIIGGDWNQYPPTYTPSERELENSNFLTIKIESEELEKYGRIIHDPDEKTLRHLDTILGENSVFTITDYFFVSEGAFCDNIHVSPLNYRNSDHNPVSISIHLD